MSQCRWRVSAPAGRSSPDPARRGGRAGCGGEFAHAPAADQCSRSSERARPAAPRAPARRTARELGYTGIIMCVWMYCMSSLKLQSIFPCFTYHSYTWLACITPPISRHVYVYCVNGESRMSAHYRITPLKLPVSERGDCSGLMLLRERDIRSGDCRGDGGSTAVEEYTLESQKKKRFTNHTRVSRQ